MVADCKPLNNTECFQGVLNGFNPCSLGSNFKTGGGKLLIELVYSYLWLKKQVSLYTVSAVGKKQREYPISEAPTMKVMPEVTQHISFIRAVK